MFSFVNTSCKITNNCVSVTLESVSWTRNKNFCNRMLAKLVAFAVTSVDKDELKILNMDEKQCMQSQ